jgi:hypothetical protein
MCDSQLVIYDPTICYSKETTITQFGIFPFSCQLRKDVNIKFTRLQFYLHYATNRKVAGSIPHEVIFFLIYLILPAALGPGDYSASNRNEYRKHKNNNVGSLTPHNPIGLQGLLRG